MAVTKWGVSLPTADELPAMPRSVVYHWTGGPHRANAVDLGAYHYVVEVDGAVKVGRWSVAANMRQVSGDNYAMHTGSFNSFRVGIAAAGMRHYTDPRNLGPSPLSEVQVRRMCEVGAYFCDLAGLNPLLVEHVCHHREVGEILGIAGTKNRTTLDITHLPHRPDLDPKSTGPYLRSLTASAMAPVLADPIRIRPIPPAPGRTFYSPSRGDYAIPVEIRADDDWSFVWWSDVLDLPRVKAGAPLSRMPEHP